MVVSLDLGRRMVAEAIGTFLLVFIGCGSVVVGSGGGLVGTALAFGFSLLIIVYAIGHVSGGHVNPAVTLGLAAAGRFPLIEVVPYWIGQIVGAIVAAGVLRWTFGNVANLGTTAPTDGAGRAFVVELVMTAVLVFVVTAVATDGRAVPGSAGLAIGGALLLNILVAGPISGGSVNPARSIGPAIVSGTLDDLWIYILAPLIGGLIGAFAYQFIREDGLWSGSTR